MKLMCLFFNFLNIFNFSCNYNALVTVENKKNVNTVYAVNDSSYVTVDDINSYLYYLDEEIVIENKLVSNVLDTINNIYLVSNDKSSTTITVYNKFNKHLSYQRYENLFVENIYNINNFIFLIGNENRSGVIYQFNYELEEINKRLFISDGNISVNHLVFDNNTFYITIFKDGITNNSEFISHGNIDEKKSIIVKLDDKFNILDTHYLNENSTCEIIKNIYINDLYIKVLLKTNSKYYIYKLNKDFSKITYYLLNTKDELELINHHKTRKIDLFLNITTGSLNTNNGSSLKEEYMISDKFKIKDYKHYNGDLYLYGINDGTKIIKLSEYEIIKEENKILNYFNLDYLDTTNIIVESWFTNLDIVVDNVEPYLDKSMCGIYEITYHIVKNNIILIDICKELIIDNYTNFINEGIYNEGKVLEFFGNAKLNGEKIYYGTKINEPGEYDIEITDINNKVTNYHIYVVPNYYKDEQIVNINATSIYHNSAYINIEINNKEIKSVIVDNQEYENYEIIEDVLVINFPKKNKNIHSYLLNGIIFLENEDEYYYSIGKQLSFNYVKELPALTLHKVAEENNFKLDINVIDNEKSFMYLKAYYNGKEQIITQDETINTDQLKLFFVYEVGGTVIEQFISEVKQNVLFETEIKIKYQDGFLKDIKIDTFLKSNSLMVLNVINDNNTTLISYLEYYEKIETSSYLRSILLISLSIVGLTILGFIGYLAIKKTKKKAF